MNSRRGTRRIDLAPSSCPSSSRTSRTHKPRCTRLKGKELVTSSDRDFTERFGKGAKEVTAPTITLTDLLVHQSLTHVDFVSIDVELHEPQVLAGFDLGRFRPSLVCIEAHPEVRQQILDYFARRDYVVVGSISVPIYRTCAFGL